jgi:hypothetical protein
VTSPRANAEAIPEVQVVAAPPVADQSAWEPTTDELGGTMGAFVNRTIGMALVKSLLHNANGTG